MKPWIETKTDEEAKLSRISHISALSRSIVKKEFWADRATAAKNEPQKRFDISFENLPLPGAFRHAAIAVRSMIKEKKKLAEDYEDELKLLYWILAVDSFSIPYSPNIEAPCYNVISSIPGEKIKMLNISYPQVGYKNLKLANKTDCKRFVEYWGEPNSHTTLYNVYNDLWVQYEEKFKLENEYWYSNY